jgi:hypothetical protein
VKEVNPGRKKKFFTFKIYLSKLFILRKEIDIIHKKKKKKIFSLKKIFAIFKIKEEKYY